MNRATNTGDGHEAGESPLHIAVKYGCAPDESVNPPAKLHHPARFPFCKHQTTISRTSVQSCGPRELATAAQGWLQQCKQARGNTTSYLLQYKPWQRSRSPEDSRIAAIGAKDTSNTCRLPWARASKLYEGHPAHQVIEKHSTGMSNIAYKQAVSCTVLSSCILKVHLYVQFMYHAGQAAQKTR